MVKAHELQSQNPDQDLVMPITGTFIYPRPPDYEGINAIHWKVEDWENEFVRLHSFGIETVILQSCITEETSGQWAIHYPSAQETIQDLSSIEKRLKVSPNHYPGVVPAILEAAKRTNMHVHLGLFNCITGWFGKSSAKSVNQIQKEEVIVARELAKLYGEHPSVAGWYISPEIIYFTHGKRLGLDMNKFLKAITKELKAVSPDLQIGISPGATLPKGDLKPVFAFWEKTLDDSGVDLLYPQDAVGQLVNYPDEMTRLWKLWQDISKQSGLELWANCENFERKSFNPPNPFEAASFPRLQWQLSAASPHVEKIVCWECMYFLNENGARKGKDLVEEYSKYFQMESK